MAGVSVERLEPILDPASLDLLGERLRAARLSPLPALARGEGWERGTPEDWLAALIEDWRAYDPSVFQRRLDSLTHVRVLIDGIEIHAVQQPAVSGPAGSGSGSEGALPLLLTHGWPGSFCEYLDLIPMLTDPAAHGGDPADAFNVVVPSLPGYGFSGPPPAGGLTGIETAELWYRLMTEGLGYRRFVAHGSDIGSGITARLARDHPDVVAGAHVAAGMLPPPPKPWSEPETTYFAEVEAWTAAEGAYAHQHATKPSTIAAALLDSPVGLASWIGEKVVAWSDVRPDGQPAFPRELLLATLTLYWSTGTIGTSLLPYWRYRQAPADTLRVGEGGPAPVAVTIFGGERIPFPKPPRELAERYFSLSAWGEHPRGGHFPAVSAPGLLAQTLRDVFRPLRSGE
ncbi:MAG: epoxide hydrolase [Acidimicrobiaceae bacterium]|nr:epoxide hydrolase [Acidimicrobiaceae bacterium]